MKCIFGHDWCAWPHTFEGEVSGVSNTIPELKKTIRIRTNFCHDCGKQHVEVEAITDDGKRYRGKEIIMGKVVSGRVH